MSRLPPSMIIEIWGWERFNFHHDREKKKVRKWLKSALAGEEGYYWPKDIDGMVINGVVAIAVKLTDACKSHPRHLCALAANKGSAEAATRVVEAFYREENWEQPPIQGHNSYGMIF